MRSITTRFAGLAIFVLGLWGGLVPFVGPYFHYSLGPTTTWTWTTGRLYLDVLPAIAAVIGGLLLMASGPWAAGRIGALLALGAGIWFVVGPDLSYLWQTGGAAGPVHGGTTMRALEPLGYHTGLGVLIAALAAYALPGFLRRPAPVAAEEGALAGAGAATAVRQPVRDREPTAADGAGAAAASRPARDREPVAATGGAGPAEPAAARTQAAGPAGAPGPAPAQRAQAASAEAPAGQRRGGLLRGLFGGRDGRDRKLGGAH